VGNVREGVTTRNKHEAYQTWGKNVENVPNVNLHLQFQFCILFDEYFWVGGCGKIVVMLSTLYTHLSLDPV
jgi:hypothetical protein